MYMRELLSELKQEVSGLSVKSLGPIGFDYRRRTRLERSLFLIAKEYCESELHYDLGGLGHNHQKMFLEYTKSYDFSSENIQPVIEAFKISEVICSLSSSDPYAREEALEELGGTIFKMLKNLARRIESFMNLIESS